MAWAPKDPEEKFALRFDFSSELSVITNAEIIVELKRGVDDDPDNILNGPLEISGASVLQRVKEGVNKCSYKFRCVASDGVETWVITQELPVRVK